MTGSQPTSTVKGKGSGSAGAGVPKLPTFAGLGSGEGETSTSSPGFSDSSGFEGDDDVPCTPAPRGKWAPLGSAVAEDCPASGFYCPGALRDDLYGGAKPIIMPVGQSTETQEVQTVGFRCGSVAVLQYGDVLVRRCDSVQVWQCGSLTV